MLDYTTDINTNRPEEMLKGHKMYREEGTWHIRAKTSALELLFKINQRCNGKQLKLIATVLLEIKFFKF